MAVSVILGGIGSGKTMLLTWFLHMYKDSGYSIYANYNLYELEYYELDQIQNFEDIETPKNCIGLDEFWITADSRRAGSLINLETSKHMLQSRKTKSDVFITVQDFGQLDVRIRNIVRFLFEPEIIKKDEFGKPELMKIKFHDYQKKNKIIKTFYLPMQFNFKHGYVDIPEVYDTFQMIDKMDEPNNLEELLKLKQIIISKYIHFNGKRNQLTTVLRTVDRIDERLISASDLSNLVFLVKEGEITQEEALQ